MEQASQGAACGAAPRGRKPRWTAQDQITAEVAAACGVTDVAIGKLLGFSRSTVRDRLNPALAARKLCATVQWRRSNPERTREHVRRYADSHPGRARLRYKANPEQERERRRRWRKANPERVSEMQRRWRKANPERASEIDRRRYAIKKTANRAALVPLTLDARLQRAALWGGRCAYCGAKDATTLDHVLALVAGGLDEPSNTAPACRRCNSSKNATPVEAWYCRQPFFTEARWVKLQRHCPGSVVGQLPLALGG
jgi:hypothetical protein